MTTQPEALRLAGVLWAHYLVNSSEDVLKAVAELRRLHAENEALRAQRDALLEALRRVCDHGTRDHLQIVADWDSARAAIDAAKERT